MERHWCVSVNNTTIDPSKYYLPTIGAALAISGCTLVCLICISIDIIQGFHHKKPWLPCKFFALNSITLSLVTLAARYPSDRTTLMLSAEEQLCKLSGTVLICISMGFFMPSLGAEKGHESIKNMASLTISVVAVGFNVIAQMFTGALFSFIFEHVVVLFFMFVLLMLLWTICLNVTQGKGSFNEFKKSYFKEFKEGTFPQSNSDEMLTELEWCYIFGYTSSPQFLLGLVTHSATIGLMCTLCALGLLEASLGALVLTELKRCERRYKSGWTMQMVLMIQMLTIIVGTFGIGYRWFTMVRHFDRQVMSTPRENWFYESVYKNLHSSPWRLSGTCFFNILRLIESCLTSTMIKMATMFEWATNLVLDISILLRQTFRRGRRAAAPNSVREEHFRDALHSRGHQVFLDWILKTAVKDMDKLIMRYKTKTPGNLIKVLLRPRPDFRINISDMELAASTISNEYWSKFRFSCLSMVILVRLVEVAIPPCSRTLSEALNDCFDIVYLIDKYTHVDNYQDEKRYMLAEDLWMCPNFKWHWLYKKIIGPSLRKQKKKPGSDPIQAAFQLIKDIRDASEKESLRGYDLQVIAGIILDFRKKLKLSTLDRLHAFLEDMFVKMFFFFLVRLPDVTKRYVWKSGVEDCGERAKKMMKVVCKVQQLEERIGGLSFSEIEDKAAVKKLLLKNSSGQTIVEVNKKPQLPKDNDMLI